MSFMLNRLKEKTTWTVILGAISIFAGINFSPELSDQIVKVGTAIVGLIIVFLKEKEVKSAGASDKPKDGSADGDDKQSIVTPDLTPEQLAAQSNG